MVGMHGPRLVINNLTFKRIGYCVKEKKHVIVFPFICLIFFYVVSEYNIYITEDKDIC